MIIETAIGESNPDRRLQQGGIMRSRCRTFLLPLLLVVFSHASLMAQSAAPTPTPAPLRPPPPAHLEIKYVRDSDEYYVLARQVYRAAAQVFLEAAKTPKPIPVVVVDVDETMLDNSIFQLERAAYEVPYDPSDLSPWNAWAGRVAAPAVPGALAFAETVHGAKGRIAFITDRRSDIADVTKEDLNNSNLWKDGDLLCTKSSETDTKVVRRKQLADGSGACSWPGLSIRLVSFVGDQITDFPGKGEPDGENEEMFGRKFFLLPNPMYGRWAGAVTRRSLK
jgi:5'-nucleotidase (lipoprotein e(P4) family)